MKKNTYGRVFSKNNELFIRAAESRYLPNCFATIIIFTMLWICCRALGQGVISLLSLLCTETCSTFSIDVSIVSRFIKCSTIVCGFFCWIKFVEKRKITNNRLGFLNALKKYLIGFTMGFILISINTILFFLLGVVVTVKTMDLNFGTNAIIGAVILLVSWVVQSASEEISVRGWLMPILGAKYNVAFSVLLTSTTFGGIHLFNPNVTILSFFNIFLAGVFLALYTIWQEDLWGVCGFHCAWNFALTNIYGFQVSGFSSIQTILKFQVNGPTFITGGDFGPEGGVLVTIFLCIGIGVLKNQINRKMDHLYKSC